MPETEALAMATIVAEIREPVSPELVLVDPELARRERARLAEEALHPSLEPPAPLARPVARAAVAAAPRGAIAEAGRGWARAVGAAVAAAALLGLGVASAVVLGPRRPTTRAEAVAGARAVQIATHGTPGRSAALDLPTSALVERRLLATLAAGPPARLPRSLVDPATGLLRNNTEVTCRHDGTRVFHCDVRLLFQPRREGFRVDYRIDGSRPAVITWHRHRHG